MAPTVIRRGGSIQTIQTIQTLFFPLRSLNPGAAQARFQTIQTIQTLFSGPRSEIRRQVPGFR